MLCMIDYARAMQGAAKLARPSSLAPRAASRRRGHRALRRRQPHGVRPVGRCAVLRRRIHHAKRDAAGRRDPRHGHRGRLRPRAPSCVPGSPTTCTATRRAGRRCWRDGGVTVTPGPRDAGPDSWRRCGSRTSASGLGAGPPASGSSAGAGGATGSGSSSRRRPRAAPPESGGASWVAARSSGRRRSPDRGLRVLRLAAQPPPGVAADPTPGSAGAAGRVRRHAARSDPVARAQLGGGPAFGFG